jgi:hypothetical protein
MSPSSRAWKASPAPNSSHNPHCLAGAMPNRPVVSWLTDKDHNAVCATAFLRQAITYQASSYSQALVLRGDGHWPQSQAELLAGSAYVAECDMA